MSAPSALKCCGRSLAPRVSSHETSQNLLIHETKNETLGFSAVRACSSTRKIRAFTQTQTKPVNINRASNDETHVKLTFAQSVRDSSVMI